VVATPAKLGFGEVILGFLEIFGIFGRKMVIFGDFWEFRCISAFSINTNRAFQ
jgi:hypothetical protein